MLDAPRYTQTQSDALLDIECRCKLDNDVSTQIMNITTIIIMNRQTINADKDTMLPYRQDYDMMLWY